jgi:hypothetical protein
MEAHQTILASNFSSYKYNTCNRLLIKLDSYNKFNNNTIYIKNIDEVNKKIAQATPKFTLHSVGGS